MNRIKYYGWLLVFSSLFSACGKEEDQNDVSQQRQYCYTVLDGINQNPLEGVYLSVSFKSHAGIYVSFPGTTDASGNICFKMDSQATFEELSVSKNGFVNICGAYYPPDATIHLYRSAALQFHIKNIPPASGSDNIYITYPGPDCNGASYLSHSGLNVDTTYIVEANPMGHYVSWSMWHNGVNTDSSLSGLFFIVNDTTNLEILY